MRMMTSPPRLTRVRVRESGGGFARAGAVLRDID